MECCFSILKLFQSTLPRRERLEGVFNATVPIDFNPHSHEGSDSASQIGYLVLVISIHTPTKGATGVTCTHKMGFTISIHTPTKGATIMIRHQHLFSLIISIHTPTKGATAILTNNFLIFCSISLINFILYLQIIQILFIFRYKFIFYFIF